MPTPSTSHHNSLSSDHQPRRSAKRRLFIGLSLMALVFAGIGGTAAAFSRLGGSTTTSYKCETPIGGPTTCECKGYIDCKAMVENECQLDNGASVIVCTPDGANCCCDSAGGSNCTPPPSTTSYPTSGSFAIGTTYLR